MKSHVLLTTALFLVCAPAPDGKDIAELTSNFMVVENQPGLSASEASLNEVPAKLESLEAKASARTQSPARSLEDSPS